MRAPSLTAICAVVLHLSVALMLGWAGIAPAWAHAVLLETQPADQASLDAAPAEAMLRFNEPVTPVFVRLIDAAGRSLALPEPPRVSDLEIRVALPAGLRDGSYILSYRVVSADSHPIGGAFLFSIGATAAPVQGIGEGGNEGGWLLARIILRFVQDAALMAAAGGALFVLLVLRAFAPPRRLRGCMMLAAAVAIIAAGLGIGVEGGFLAAAPANALLDPETWRLGASTTLATGAMVMSAGLALALPASRKQTSPVRFLALPGAASAAASLALTGHAAASPWPSQLALALHAVTVAFWLGSLGPLLMILRDRPVGEAATILRRFSALAVPAVLLLVIAGLAAALQRIGSPAELLATAYGRLLLGKLALVALLLGLAALNRYRLTPAFTADGSARASLVRTIGAEIVLAGAILLVTATLAHAPPPGATGQVRHVYATEKAGHSASAANRGHRVDIGATPAVAGHNRLDLRLTGPDGAAFDALELTLALSLPAAGIEPIVRIPDRVAPGAYRLAGSELSVPGRWTVRVDALISDFEKVTFAAELTVR